MTGGGFLTYYVHDYAGNISFKSFYEYEQGEYQEKHYTQYTYDGNNRLTQSVKTTYDPVYELIEEPTTYTYDNNGNMLSQSTTVEGTTTNTAYSYDNFNKLTQMTTGNQTTAYQYSADGMRASKNVAAGSSGGGVKTDYVWDGATLIGEVYGQTAAQKFTVTEGTTAIGISLRSTGDTAGITVDIYPWNGSLAASIAGTAVASETIEIYTDETDGVVQLSGLTPGEYMLYAHSGYGGAGLELLGEGEGAYRDGQAIAGEYIYWVYQTYDEEAYALKQSARTSNPSNIETIKNSTEYVPITGGAEGIEIDKKYINGLGLEFAVNDVADIQTFVGNHRGDIIALLDGNNRPIANYVYDAYGTEREESFTYNGFFAKFGTNINSNRYAGQYLDNESGNYYLRARYYDPATSRMLSPDQHWNPGNMIYGDNPQGNPSVPDITAIMQSSNFIRLCFK